MVYLELGSCAWCVISCMIFTFSGNAEWSSISNIQVFILVAVLRLIFNLVVIINDIVVAIIM